MRSWQPFLIWSWKLVAIGCLGITLAACHTSRQSGSPFEEDWDGGTGAASPSAPTGLGAGTSGRLRVGEALTITFSDLPTPIAPFDGRIKEDGKITLMQNQEFGAAGKTVAELEKEIRDRYVPKYFVNMTATVKAQDRFFYVVGEVRAPSRQPYVGNITVVGVIAASGGFTDFAKQTKVQIIRANGTIEFVNYKKVKNRPEMDKQIFPGDRIIVPRRWW